jgi:hypothetical protein
MSRPGTPRRQEFFVTHDCATHACQCGDAGRSQSTNDDDDSETDGGDLDRDAAGRDVAGAKRAAFAAIIGARTDLDPAAIIDSEVPTDALASVVASLLAAPTPEDVEAVNKARELVVNLNPSRDAARTATAEDIVADLNPSSPDAFDAHEVVAALNPSAQTDADADPAAVVARLNGRDAGEAGATGE